MNNDYIAGFESGYEAAQQAAYTTQAAQYEEFQKTAHACMDLARNNSTTQAGLFIYLTHIENDGFNYRSETGMLVVYFKVGAIILLPNKMIEIVYTGKGL